MNAVAATPKSRQMTSPRTHVLDSKVQSPKRAAVELLRRSLQYLDTNRDAAGELILKACSILEDASEPEQGTGRLLPGGLVLWQIQRISAHVEANINGRVTIPELAALARLGPSHFRRAFKRCFGVGPHAYLILRRIRRAQDLMITTDYSLSEIAVAVGFADQAHLTTRFRRAVGTTPHIWRRERNADTKRRTPRVAQKQSPPNKPVAVDPETRRFREINRAALQVSTSRDADPP